MGHDVGRHFVHELKGWSTELTEYLLAEEEKHANSRLPDTDGTNAILHIGRRRVRPTLNSQPWEFPLQLKGAAFELPIDLSGSTVLNAQNTVHHLNGWFVIARHDVELREVNIFCCRLLVDLQKDRGPD